MEDKLSTTEKCLQKTEALAYNKIDFLESEYSLEKDKLKSLQIQYNVIKYANDKMKTQ